jgi:Fungal specific transcription factor domain
MTQRIGGYLRPQMTEAVRTSTQLYCSPLIIIQLSCQLNLPRTESQSQEEQSSSALLISPSTSPHFQPAWQDKESFLEPGPTYIAPGSGLLFGNTGNPGRHTPIFDFLPSRLAGDRLIKQYHDAAHFIARAIHWPSFQTQYDRFWANITAGIEPSGCLQALVFAVMFSATVSMNEAEVVELFSVPKSKLVAGFQTATEAGLAKANFLRTTKIETLQALVIYLIPMCRSEMSRAHAVLVGTAIRIAECMGLHRDPEQAFGLGPLESHVRRILWFQLCFLDIRTTEAQAPRPLIKRDDFDSAFPLNINDADLISGNPGESNGWTDMTFSKIRFECNEMHRVIWLDRLRLEKKQIGLTHVLGKIESFRKAMETKYHPIIDETVPLQKEAKLVMNLLLLKMHIMVLHRYHTSDVPIPDRLRHVTLSSEIQMMEDAIRLETNAVLQPWAWYCGTYQQWHTALLLLMEAFSFPMRQEADRIWRVLDYVFETDPSMERQQKSRAIISEIRDRTAASKDFRKIRAPISMLPIYNTFTRRPANGQSTDVELDFNSDPAPLVSRVVHHPLQTGRTSSERDCEPGSYPGAAEPTHKPGPQSQGSSQSPSQSSQRLNSVTAVRLAEMTKAYADAPSPMSPIDPPHEQSWTFDAPSNYYVGMHRTAYPKKVNRKQTTQNTAPTTATINPDGHMNPSVRLEPGLPQKTYAWSGEVSAGNRAYANNAPQGLDVGAMPLDLLSATGNAVGDSTKMRGGLGETGVSEMEPDLMMIDIDWVSFLSPDMKRIPGHASYNIILSSSSPVLLFALDLSALCSRSWLH